MQRILTIVGARPQFIKAGTVSREISIRTGLEEVIVHTGQHYDKNMSDIFFDEMKIPKPDYALGIGGKSHGSMTGQMIEEIEKILIKERPDWVLVYGDTNSTLAGALAACKLKLKIAHVEAGLRSFNMNMPEEINRILTDRISSVLFCPTETAVSNLVNEGVESWGATVNLSGDVMQDGALFYKKLAINPVNFPLEGEFILSTIHRAENTDEDARLTNIIEALNHISESVPVVLPLHPRTKARLDSLGLRLKEKVYVIEPVGYLNMVWLLDKCRLVMTDSGGLQKEAFFFKKACITLRDETEWTELVDRNFNCLVGADKNAIIEAFKNHRFSNEFETKLFGTGRAAVNIVDALVNYDN